MKNNLEGFGLMWQNGNGMKIGDSILSQRGLVKVIAINDITKQYKYEYKSHPYGIEIILEANESSKGFTFIRPKFFGLFGGYWTNKEYLKKKKALDEENFQRGYRKHLEKKGWRFDD